MSNNNTRYINFSLIAVIFFALIFAVKGYHAIKRTVVKKKLQNTEFSFSDSQTKLVFIENVNRGGLLEPPFGDIVVTNLHNFNRLRLNYDGYFDRSPTLSKSKNCIYFESKRGVLAKELHLGSPSDIYKIDLSDFEIKLAREDVSFALKDSSSAIEKPKVSGSNDSLMVFVENGTKQDYLVLCNYINKNVLYRERTDSIANFWLGNEYLLIQRKYNMYPNDSARYYYYDFMGLNTMMCGHILTGNVVGFTCKGEVIEIKKVGDKRIISKVFLKIEKKEQFYEVESDNWIYESDFSSIRYFLGDTSLIIDKYTNSEISNVLLFKEGVFKELTKKPRKRMDYDVWY